MGCSRNSNVVIPCYNEARRLNVQVFREFLQSSSDVGFIFVDDGSTDTTVETIQSICSGFEESSSFIRLEKNSGKAEAVRFGLQWAIAHCNSQIVGFWDADLAAPLDAIQSLTSILHSKRNIEMAFGARVRLLGRTVQRTPLRHYVGRAGATVIANSLRLPIYDTQCGAKLFRVSPELEKVLAEPFLSRWLFDVEMIARFQKEFADSGIDVRNRIYEYPLESWAEISGSKLRTKDFVRALLDLKKIRDTYRSRTP